MAITSLSGLYPPIIDTYKPAFVMEGAQAINIFFNFSPYMSIADETIYAQIILTEQNSNISALNSSYSMGIKRQAVQISLSNGLPFITINNSDLKNNGFLLNTYYKLQIRLDNVNDNVASPNSNWINEHLDNFSEWSTVCLIRRIATPQLYLWNTQIAEDIKTFQLSSVLQVNGAIIFNDSSETETLRRYQLLLKKDNEIIEASDIIYTNIYQNPNEFNYIFKTVLKEGTYQLDIRFETKNYYTDQKTINIAVDSSQIKDLNIDIKVIPDEDCARNKIILTSSDKIVGLYEIARASENSNFNVWTTIQNFSFLDSDWNNEEKFISNITTKQKTLSEMNINSDISAMICYHIGGSNNNSLQTYSFVLADQTIEGGVRYKYRIQQKSGAEIFKKESDIVLNMFENIFLVSNNKNLKIGFNENISSIKPVLSISKVDTIGGQFPFIKKNGNMNYRQFSIGGLISVLADINETFVKKDLLFGGVNYNAHKEYVEANNISQFNDYILERKYRDAVIKYLTNRDVKLLKSITEGNILVQLTDVNLTPQQSLGRYIYSFSATAYEIDEATEDNYIKYNIQPLEVDTSSITYYLVTTKDEYIEITDEEKLSVNIREE